MVVVVVIPDADRLAPFVLAVVGAGVETFVGHQSLVALDLPVVAGRVGPSALLPANERAGRHGRLVLESLGAGQAGEPVLHRVEVGVADLLLMSALARQGLVAAAAVGPPAAAVGNLPDLLHVHVDHVPGVAGDDLARPAQILALGSDVADPIQPEAVQPARHSPHAAADVVSVGELAGDPAGGPLPFPSPVLDQLDYPGSEPRRALGGGAGAVLEAEHAVVAIAGNSLRQRGPRDVELGRDMRDRAALSDHLVDRTLPSEHGQRGITVGHGTGPLPDDGCLGHVSKAGG